MGSLFFCLIGLVVITPPVMLAGFLVRTRGLNARAKLLYLATLVLELPGVAARAIIAVLITPIVLTPVWVLFGFIVLVLGLIALITGEVAGRDIGTNLLVSIGGGLWGFASAISLVLGFGFVSLMSWGPLLWSFANLLGLRGGNRFTPWALGARRPSDRERDAIVQALTTIRTRAQRHIQGPSHWYVIDAIEERAFVIGTTLYVTRQLLRSKHLTALLAHELGFVNAISGRMVLALRRLVVPPIYLLSYALRQLAPGNLPITSTSTSGGYAAAVTAWVVSALLAAAGGGLGEFVLYPLWVGFWRTQVYEADRFAAELGFAQGLIDYLEQHEFFDVAVPYFFTPEPYVELRIDELMRYQRTSISQTIPVTAQLAP